jgi:hypothetical protein
MRTFTELAKADPLAMSLVDELPNIKNSPADYQHKMFEIGKHLAEGMLPKLRADRNEICVVCTVEDADFLARGLIEHIEASGLGDRVHLICLWNDKIREENISLSPVVREYKEAFAPGNTSFVIVKSIISGACVVKTNLTRALSFAKPEKIFVAAPVMLIGAEKRLAREFPKEISEKFDFIHFAVDTEKNGENVIPGIGGSVYELLGFKDSKAKNRYIPKLVKERRRKFYGAPALATS